MKDSTIRNGPIIIFILLVIICCNHLNKPKVESSGSIKGDNPFCLQAEQIFAYSSSTGILDTNYSFLIRLGIINTSQSSHEFYLSRGGGIFNIVVTSEDFKLQYPLFQDVRERFIKLGPSEQLYISVLLRGNRINKFVKFGFVINDNKSAPQPDILVDSIMALKQEDFKDISNFMALQKLQGSIIWSDSIKLKYSSDHPYYIDKKMTKESDWLRNRY
jgi:hypothetical protein